jgi:hypothetical protein
VITSCTPSAVCIIMEGGRNKQIQGHLLDVIHLKLAEHIAKLDFNQNMLKACNVLIDMKHIQRDDLCDA